MKKFLLYLSSLIIVVITLLFLLDSMYTYAYNEGVPRNKIAHILAIKDTKIDYIFIGSSRVDNAIDPQIIQSVTGNTSINLGIQGGKLDDSFFLLQLLTKQNIKSKTIFIQVDYVYNFLDNSEILKSTLMPYIHNDFFSSFIQQRDPDYWALKNLPFYRYLRYDYKIGFREFFNTSIGKKPHIDLQHGYSPNIGNGEDKMTLFLPDHILDQNPSINAINSFAEKNNLKIIYFIAPLCSGTENIEFVTKLREKLPVLWDFSTVLFNEEKHFYDCAHLNDFGAKEFSKILGEKIKEERSNIAFQEK